MSNDHETHPENLQRGGLWYGTLALAVLIVCMIAVHVSFLRAPYFWDETYFAPAAHDVLATGSLIPISVPVESHPPLVYVWVALWWKLFGFSIAVARISMLAVAMFTLVGVYRLARLFTTGTVPILVTLLTAIYPVFFAESTMVQLDMAAAGLTVWALVAYLRGRRWETAVLFSLAVLAKETAIVAPAVIAGLEIVMALRECKESIGERIRAAWQASYPMLLPLASLLCWFGWMYHKTRTPFGDTGYVQYNTGGSLRPMRMALAGAQHLYHLLIYLNLFVLTGLAAIVCVVTRPRASAESAAGRNNRGWLTLGVVAAGYVVMLSLVGGVTLARYLLPVYPLVVLGCVAAISARVRWWPAIAAVTAIAFVAGLFPYTNRFLFRRDDNLAYLDFVSLHQKAAKFVADDAAADGRNVKVMTVWPGSSELAEPWLGYRKGPMEVLEVDTFWPKDLAGAKAKEPNYILMFPRRVCKMENPLLNARWWHQAYFRGGEEATPQEVAQEMNARVVYHAESHCDWVAVLKVEGKKSE